VHVGLLLGSLRVGGAERQFVELARGLAGRGHRVSFFTVYRGGALEADLYDVAGIEHRSLHGCEGGAGWRGVLRSVRSLRAALRSTGPDVLYTALYAANLIGVLASRGTGVPVVWGVRSAAESVGWKERLPLVVGRAFARSVQGLISNSRRGLDVSRGWGYRTAEAEVIPNGIRTDRFRPDRTWRTEFRERYGFGPKDIVVGLVGRNSVAKGHALFLAAAGKAAQADSHLRFVCVTPDKPNGELRDQWRARLGDRAELLRFVAGGTEVERIYPGLDLLCSASSGEGFPNVVGEGMAAGLPVLATDVGDTALIVDECGTVVPTGDVDALAAGMVEFARMDADRRRRLGREARARVVDHFSVEQLLERTERCLTAWRAT